MCTCYVCVYDFIKTILSSVDPVDQITTRIESLFPCFIRELQTYFINNGSHTYVPVMYTLVPRLGPVGKSPPSGGLHFVWFILGKNISTKL